MPTDRQLLFGGATVLVLLLVFLLYRMLRDPSSQTVPTPEPEPVPQAIMAQRIREALTLNQIMFCVRLAYITAGHGIGYSQELRGRVLRELFGGQAGEAFAAELNQLLRISPRFMKGEYSLADASPLTPQQMCGTDELLTFLASYVGVLQQLHGRILWGSTFAYSPNISWYEVDETFRQLERIYAEHTQDA